MLTAFNVLSYPLLQPDPTDPMLAALQQISSQLNSFSVNPSFINSTQPVPSSDQFPPPFHASVSAVWINTLWFASLVCSLASASIALMVKQWLFEGSKGLSGTSREAARLRQYRLNSLIKWHVGAIVLVPSVLLQVALFLFLTGLLVLLWTIHETVATVITALVSALLVFVVFVTILPIFRSDCCYRSPQAFGVLMVAKLLWNGSILLALTPVRWLGRTIVRRSPLNHDGTSLQYPYPPGLFLRLCMACILRIQEIPLVSTWHGAEQTEVARDNEVLDRNIATTAYTTTFATEHLESLHILISDLPCSQVFSCLSDIHTSWIRLRGTNDHVRRLGKLAEILFGKPFCCALRKVLAVDSDKRDGALGMNWTELRFKYRSWVFIAQNNIPLSAEFLSNLAHLSIGGSSSATQASQVLIDCFYSDRASEHTSSFVTYDTIRDGEFSPFSWMLQIAKSGYLLTVMAMARYNVMAVDWDTSSPRDSENKPWAVCLSLQFTSSMLVNNAGLSIEQEAWIRTQLRRLLSCLMEKMTETLTDVDFRRILRLISFGLNDLCRDVSRAYEMVPDQFLFIESPISFNSSEDLDFPGLYETWEPYYLNTTIRRLQQSKQYPEQHTVR